MTRRHGIAALAGLIAFTMGASAQVKDSPGVQLQAAIKQALVDGDCKGAIGRFKSIAQQGPAEIAAQALLHLADCHDKLGQFDVRMTYERVVREHPNQKEPVAKARAWLDAHPRPARSSDDAGAITIRKVWSGTDSNVDPRTGRLSPDGRFLTYVHWETGNLAVRDLTTGENRDVTTEGGYSKCSQYAWESVWSPSGREIAYHWLNCDDETPHHSLRIVRADGSERRVLLRAEGLDWPAPIAWTPDGRQIVVLAGRTDRTWQIALVSVSDGSMRVLKTLDWRKPGRVSLSPDGRYLAYDLPASQTDDRRDLFILATDGSQEERLVEHSANDGLPVWIPGGGAVVFVSDRTGTDALWRVDVAAGRPVGEPQLVKESAGLWPVGFAPDGAFYYGAQLGRRNVWTVAFDPAAGALVGEPVLAATSFMGRNALPEWSPDGRYLAYLSVRTQAQASPGYMRATLVIRDVRAGTDRTLSPNIAFCTNCGLRWSPDSRVLAVRGQDEKGRTGIHAIDVGDGTISPLVVDAGRRWWAEWLPGGDTIMFHRVGADGPPHHIVVRDLKSGVERKLASGETIGMFAPSRDGRLLAYTRMLGWETPDAKRELAVMPLAGGESRSLTGPMQMRGAYWWDPRYIQWTPDGRLLLFGTSFDRAGVRHSELWKVSTAGGRPQLVGILPSAQVCDLRIAPDGKQLAFDDCSAGTQELWVMKNMLRR